MWAAVTKRAVTADWSEDSVLLLLLKLPSPRQSPSVQYLVVSKIKIAYSPTCTADMTPLLRLAYLSTLQVYVLQHTGELMLVKYNSKSLGHLCFLYIQDDMHIAKEEL